jgi:hypothetical protein
VPPIDEDALQFGVPVWVGTTTRKQNGCLIVIGYYRACTIRPTRSGTITNDFHADRAVMTGVTAAPVLVPSLKPNPRRIRMGGARIRTAKLSERVSDVRDANV